MAVPKLNRKTCAPCTVRALTPSNPSVRTPPQCHATWTQAAKPGTKRRWFVASMSAPHTNVDSCQHESLQSGLARNVFVFRAAGRVRMSRSACCVKSVVLYVPTALQSGVEQLAPHPGQPSRRMSSTPPDWCVKYCLGREHEATSRTHEQKKNIQHKGHAWDRTRANTSPIPCRFPPMGCIRRLRQARR